VERNKPGKGKTIHLHGRATCDVDLPEMRSTQSRPILHMRQLRDETAVHLDPKPTMSVERCTRTNPAPKSMKIQSFLICAVLTPLITPTSYARPPRAQQAVGVVREIDRSSQQLTLATKASTSKTLHWDKQTRIWRNGQETSGEAVSRGSTIECLYRVPFFGPPSMTKIRILGSAQSAQAKDCCRTHAPKS
jgi:hypothetical protein